MLNNRQPGRRRGRTNQNQRPQSNGGRGQEQGNRVDNRARGNAPQMLEKYKALARDAQLQGDRVITEYYLQFADHYFRVVAETRARFEETRRQRDDWQGEDGDAELTDNDERIAGDMGDGEDDEAAAERAYEAQRRQPRQPQQRDARPFDNRGRDDRPREDRPREDRPFDDQASDRGARPRGDNRDTNQRDNGQRDYGQRNTAPRDTATRDGAPRESATHQTSARHPRFSELQEGAAPARIDVNVLPPAFGSDGPISPIADHLTLADSNGETAPKRRGRPRKPVADDASA